MTNQNYPIAKVFQPQFKPIQPTFTSKASTKFPRQKNFPDDFIIPVTFVTPKLILPFR